MRLKFTPALLVLLPAADSSAAWALSMPAGVAGLSTETYALHALVFYGCAAIAAMVFAAMIYSIFRHRQSQANEATDFSYTLTAEVAWTLVPIVMLLLVAAPPAESLLKLAAGPKPELTILATAYRSKWHYQYAGRDLAFFSSPARNGAAIDAQSAGDLPGVDRPLTVPENTWVRLLLTPDDVVHPWRMPDLELRQVVKAGSASETWFRAGQVGLYRGGCTELCDLDHGLVPVMVKAVDAAAFQAWLQDARSRASRLASAE